MNKKKVVIAAGGTGGHLLPAQEIARKLQEQNIDITFIGAGLQENAYFNREQFTFAEISAKTPFQKRVFSILQSLYTLLKGIKQSYILLKDLKPDLIVSFGSFHVFPVLCVAKLQKRPFVLFESNTVAGKVTRFFSSFALHTAIHLPLVKQLKGNLIEISWPLKPEDPKLSQQEARKQLQLDPNCFTILVFGGSQGASTINGSVLTICKQLLAKGRSFQIIHLTGKLAEPVEVVEFCRKHNIPAVVKPFEKNMSQVFYATDVAVCRSGAATIAELIHYQIPALLIPYPYATGQHQRENALFLERLSAARIIEEGTDMQQLIVEVLDDFYRHPEIREQIRSALKNLSTRKKEMSDLIIETLHG